MSALELADDILHFRLGKAGERLEDWLKGTIFPEAETFLKKLASDEGKMLEASVEAHIGDLDINSPTASFVKVCTEIAADIAVKAPSILLQDIFAFVNIKVAAK